MSLIPTRLKRYWERFPHYMAFQAPPWAHVVFIWLHYWRCIPRLQDAPVLVLTMGKVGTRSIEHALNASGYNFCYVTHRLTHQSKRYPCDPWSEQHNFYALAILRHSGFPWLLTRPKLRIVTSIREPISRLVSLYLFAYPRIFGESIEQTSLEILLARFPQIFDRNYVHPLVPGEFLGRELHEKVGIDVYAHPFSSEKGWTIIQQNNLSIFLSKLEIPDSTKELALTEWIEKPVRIVRQNTASQSGYAEIYAAFKKRVHIPYRYAEAIHRSRYMTHFYTSKERTELWLRWAPQLDRSIELPVWVERELATFHPPVTDLPVESR